VQAELTKALAALGIKRALVYLGSNSNESYAPVGHVIKRIPDNIDERLNWMKQRRVA
jgi:hypothetical protein